MKIEHCPFCGGKGEVKECNGKHYVECTSCGVTTAKPRYQDDEITQGRIIRQWNKRPAPYGAENPEGINYCPFCGNTHTFCVPDWEDNYYVYCDFCYAESGKYPTKEEAIKAWDRRV